MNPSAPESVPLLARGHHRDPREGVCLMEYVSLLAGEPFSDHPRCTHPLLAHLARLVNDTVSAAARPRLALLAPDLIETTGPRPALAAQVMATVAEAAVAVQPHSRHLQRVATRARRRAASAAARPSWREVLLWRGAIDGDTITIRGLVCTIAGASDRDERLSRLLAQAIASCRGRQQGDHAEPRHPWPEPAAPR